MTVPLTAEQQALAVQYMPLAKKLAAKYMLTDFDEAAADAYVGLVIAARRFDPSLNYKFSTYARWWIEAALRLHRMREGQGQVRHIVTVNDRVVYHRLGRAVRALGEAASSADLAAYLGVDEESVAHLSLDVGLHEEAKRSPLLNLRSADEEMELVRDRLLNENPRSLQLIADEWGVSRQRVQQIESEIVSKLRHVADGGTPRKKHQGPPQRQRPRL